MKKDAELHAEEDKKKRELIDTRNQAEAVVAAAERSLREAGDKVPADVKTQVEATLESIKKVKDGDDVAAIRRELDSAQAVISKIGEAMYKNATPPPTDTPTDGGQPQPEAGKTVDAEFEDKKEATDQS